MIMNNKNELPQRKPTRLKNFDYSNRGAYFITICTQNRRQILSRVVGTGVLDGPKSIELLPYGIIADKYINQLNDFYDNIKIVRYVIMPNHIHILLFVKERGPSRTPVPTKQNSTVSCFVSTFKRFCNKEYGENIWQYRFHDHIIRNYEDYEEHLRYIAKNPLFWDQDELFIE